MARNNNNNRNSNKPGTPAPDSGLYDIVGPRGGDTGLQVTAVLGHRLPPTPKPGQTFVLVTPANNGAGKGEK
jgi:hypothetical protein